MRNMQAQEDYRQYYENETYFLKYVGARFQGTGEIEPVDFFSCSAFL
jgi:hypothetical protein